VLVHGVGRLGPAPEGEEVVGLITPFDPAFEEAMAIYAEGAKRYRNAMRELAK
jgi:hypothetical protein